jgi:hypothetical protein
MINQDGGLYRADTSSQPAVVAVLIVLVSLVVALLFASGHDAPVDAMRLCPVPATNTAVTAPPTGTISC